jgi:hypothetical protein
MVVFQDCSRVTGYSEVKVSCGLVPRNALVLTELINSRALGDYTETGL